MSSPRYCATAAEAVSVIEDHERVWLHGMAATPQLLCDALAFHARSRTNIQLLHLHSEGIGALCDPSLKGHVFHRCFFMDSYTRGLIDIGMADYVPVFLSEVPKLLKQGIQPIDTALIQVSPPDKHGICSLGISVEATRAACLVARRIIAQINPNMPRTHGDGFIHLDDIDIVFEQAAPLSIHPIIQPDATAIAIGKQVASLIEDGACLQMGIGAIPNAVLDELHGHRHLGIHTEMFSDGAIKLIESGAIDNSCKKIHPGKVVTGFVIGSQHLYDFVDDNPEIVFLDIEYVNDTVNIRRNKKVVAVNSAIQVDLSGQVCADSIGPRIYSGFGGQMDFVRGAALSEGGKAIIALPSTAAKGTVSRIAFQLDPGAGVVTTRAHVQYVVTEYGVADLRGKTLAERAKALIAIAHPAFRETLTQQFYLTRT
jgi:acyl-CoA hydrolase